MSFCSACTVNGIHFSLPDHALQGDKQGLVRCKDEAAAKALLERDSGKATIGGQAAKLRVLEGAPMRLHAWPCGSAVALSGQLMWQPMGIMVACPVYVLQPY